MRELDTGSLVGKLLEVYELIFVNPTFDTYEARAGSLDEIYMILQSRKLSLHDKEVLAEIEKKHNQLIGIILSEKNALHEQRRAFEESQRASSSYEKVIAGSMNNSYFFDRKK